MTMAANPLFPVEPPFDTALGVVVQEVTALAPQRQLLDPQLVAAAVRAWSANTVRAFLSDLRLWDAWCRRSHVQTGLATATTVATYMRALSGQDVSTEAARATEQRSAATIARYLVHIGWAYRMAGRDDPTAAPLVRLELKAARKVVGTRQTQARAIRFKGDVVDLDGPAAGVSLSALIKACRNDMLGARDEALLRVAYDTGCRRSELVAIDVRHIDGPDGEGAGTLLIPRSKTDREGQGALAYLSPATMRAIDRWRDLGGSGKVRSIVGSKPISTDRCDRWGRGLFIPGRSGSSTSASCAKPSPRSCSAPWGRGSSSGGWRRSPAIRSGLVWPRIISLPARACQRSCRPIAGVTPIQSCAMVRSWLQRADPAPAWQSASRKIDLKGPI